MPFKRIDDGMIGLTPQQRYAWRKRIAGCCPTCGHSLPTGRTIRCKSCMEKRDTRSHYARVQALWATGAPIAQIHRLCIGSCPPPRRWRGKTEPLHLSCHFCHDSQEIRWHGEVCRSCGKDLWGKGIEKAVRRRWMRMTDQMRMDELIG